MKSLHCSIKGIYRCWSWCVCVQKEACTRNCWFRAVTVVTGNSTSWSVIGGGMPTENTTPSLTGSFARVSHSSGSVTLSNIQSTTSFFTFCHLTIKLPWYPRQRAEWQWNPKEVTMVHKTAHWMTVKPKGGDHGAQDSVLNDSETQRRWPWCTRQRTEWQWNPKEVTMVHKTACWMTVKPKGGSFLEKKTPILLNGTSTSHKQFRSTDRSRQQPNQMSALTLNTALLVLWFHVFRDGVELNVACSFVNCTCKG